MNPIKRVIVTGASSGIGRAVVDRLLSSGSHVVALDINGAALKKLDEKNSKNFLALKCDISKQDQFEAAFQKAVDTLGGIDAVHLNAGILGDAGTTPFWDLELSDFRTTWDVNVLGAFIGIRTAMRYFIKENISGSILVTGSIASVYGASRLVPYTVSKHAIHGMVKAAAVQGAKHQVRVNMLSPSMTETEMAKEISSNPGSGTENSNTSHFASQVPLARLANPVDMAGPAEFLLSDAAQYVTGQNLLVDGGLSVENPLRGK